jgi:hypothetical protein
MFTRNRRLQPNYCLNNDIIVEQVMQVITTRPLQILDPKKEEQLWPSDVQLASVKHHEEAFNRV